MSFLREQPSRGEAPQPGNGHRSRKEGDRARDERCEGTGDQLEMYLLGLYYGLMLAMGPGFCSELVLLRW